MNYNKTINGETMDNTEGNEVCYKKTKTNYKLFTKYKILNTLKKRFYFTYLYTYIAKKRKIIS